MRRTLSKRQMGAWGLRLLLCLFFLVGGVEKLRASWHIASNFEAQGLSMGFMYAIGALEIMGALGLLWTRYARYAAFWLAAITLFTAVSSVLAQLWDAAVAAVVVLALLAGLIYWLKPAPELPS